MSARGTLRVFLGAAPGVGKTFAMLEEAHRLAAQADADVVVGLVLDHGRAETAQLVEGLEVLPLRRVEYRGASFEELDVERVLARRPAWVLVDEYAHSNVPGSEHEKRWQDVQVLLEAGLNVLTTMNVQHLESLTDAVAQITGVRQAETVPDEVVRRADEIELVDIPPPLLRQRLTDGRVYRGDKIDAALHNYFRLGNLTALRELALLWLADRVDEGLEQYRAENGISQLWPTRERVVVGLTGGAEGEQLLRRAARIMKRVNGADLLAVHVRASDGVASESPRALAAQRRLVKALGGSFHIVASEDPAAGLLEFARGVNATQVVVGVSRRGRLARLFRMSTGSRVVRESGDIDVHMVTHDYVAQGRVPLAGRDLGSRRLAAGYALALVLPAFIQVSLHLLHTSNVASAMLLQLSGAVVVSLLGGVWPALVGALWSTLLVNYFSTPPIGTLTIADPQNLLALIVFVGVSVAVASVVDRSARRSREAAMARAEATTLSDLARTAARSDDPVEALLREAVHVFRVQGAVLYAVDARSGALTQVAGAGGEAGAGEAGARDSGFTPESDIESSSEQIDESLRLVLYGREIQAHERRLLSIFGVHLGGHYGAQLRRNQAS